MPPGFHVPNREWTNWGVGYHPATVGLEKILTCVAYIGHWAVQGVIVCYNNHPAIVDSDTFMNAFNFLSPVTIEGPKIPTTNHFGNRPVRRLSLNVQSIRLYAEA